MPIDLHEVERTMQTYGMTVTAPERAQLLVALELARGLKLRDPHAMIVLRDLDPEQADVLADRLFLATTEAGR